MLPHLETLQMRRRRWPIVAFVALASFSSAAGEPSGPKQKGKDGVGINIGREILDNVVEIANWNQPEIDKYYEVLDFARRTEYSGQRERAKQNLLSLLDVREREARDGYDKDLRAIREKADEYGKLKTIRLESFAKQKRDARLKVIAGYRSDLTTFPFHRDLVKDLVVSKNDNQPSRFHGKLVTLHGYVRSLISYPAEKNKEGIETLYEAWLYPLGREKFEKDDLRSNPVVIICTSIPDGMPTGEKIAEAATVTGYVFKLHRYKSKIPVKGKPNQTKPLVCPMILASRIEWQPRPSDPAIPAWAKGAIVGGILLFLIVMVLYTRRGKPDRKLEATFDNELEMPR